MASSKKLLGTAKSAYGTLEDRIVGYPNMYRLISRVSRIPDQERQREKLNYNMRQMVAMPAERAFVTMVLQAEDVFNNAPPESITQNIEAYLGSIREPESDLPVNEMFDQNPHLCESGIDPETLGTLHSYVIHRMNKIRPQGRKIIDYDHVRKGFDHCFTGLGPTYARISDAASRTGRILYKGLDFVRDTIRGAVFLAGLAGLAFTGFALYSYSTGNYNRDAAMHVFEPPKLSTDYDLVLQRGHGIIKTRDQDYMIHYLFLGMTLSDIKQGFPDQDLEFSDFHMIKDGRLVKIPVDKEIYENLQPQYIAFPIKNKDAFRTGYVPGQ
jgi:hypothetical protein